MSSLYKLTAFALAAVSLTGCAEVAKVRTSIENEMPIARQGFDTPAAAAKSRVQESDEAFIPVSKSQFTRQKSSWLMAKRMEFTAPTPQRISNFVAALAEKGINVIYDMPLDSYTYTGTLSNTDAENAMRIVLGSAGLDYEVDDVRQIVTIKPLPVKTGPLRLATVAPTSPAVRSVRRRIKGPKRAITLSSRQAKLVRTDPTPATPAVAA
jgi:hypothetical protein